LKAEPLTGLVMMMWALSYSAVRTPLSPILEMRPVSSVSPDWWCHPDMRPNLF
jgi:hypothetical protein